MSLQELRAHEAHLLLALGAAKAAVANIQEALAALRGARERLSTYPADAAAARRYLTHAAAAVALLPRRFHVATSVLAAIATPTAPDAGAAAARRPGGR